MPRKSIFVIYEKYEDLKSCSFEILGYTTTEEEADRIVLELDEYERQKKLLSSSNPHTKHLWQEMVLEEDCLDNIKPREWPVK